MLSQQKSGAHSSGLRARACSSDGSSAKLELNRIEVDHARYKLFVRENLCCMHRLRQFHDYLS